MKHMWVIFLCLAILLNLVAYSQNHECVNGRKWQIGYTMYENHWNLGNLYVHARCNDSSHVLPSKYTNWNLCETGKLRRGLPRCEPEHEEFFKCEVGKRWQDGITKYEVISHDAASSVVAACTAEGFVIDRAAALIRCDNSISNRDLPQCWKGEVTNRFDACATGRRSHSDDYEFENVWHHGSLYVRVFCIHEGTKTRSDKILCENGKMKRTLTIDFCKIQENDDKACVLGKKWTANDTEYEIRAIGSKLIVKGKCILPGYDIGRLSIKLCEYGRIPEVLPECKAVDLTSSTVSPESQAVHTTNGHISHAADESIGSFGRNKCRIENGGCSQICNYKNRSIECSCSKGYELQDDNKTCAEKIYEDACFPGKKWTANDTDYEIISYGSSFIVLIMCKDPSVFRIAGGRWELCEQGRIPSELPQCKAITLPPRTATTVTDKCHLTNGGCDPICNYINGTAHCSCNEGYELHWDNKSCIDINECMSQNFGCSDKCLNTLGSAFCSCPVGFTLQSDRKQCTDIDECENNTTNKCHHQCVNTEGSYKCSCHPGYVLINDFKCEDKNLLDACATGRSHKDDYEFEYVWHHGALFVRVFCIHEGMETKSETIPCENGKMKRTPPIDFCYEPYFW